MKRTMMILSALAAVLCFGCRQESAREAAFRHYCGSCHLPPAPEDLPKAVWENNVLPDMGARLGIRTPGFDPLAGKPQTEHFIYKTLAIYPENQLISDQRWRQIRDFILANAPDSLPRPLLPPLREAALFSPFPLSTDTLGGAMTTCLSYQDGALYAASVFGQVLRYNPRQRAFSQLAKRPNPVSSVAVSGPAIVATEIGQMHPTDLFYGETWRLENGKAEIIADQLQRPVHTLAEDIDGDGREEFFICEFGNQSGKFSMIYEQNGKREKKVLISLPGTIKSFAEDMDADGKKDLVVLAAQAQEGVWILYQKEGLSFTAERALSLSPVYGTSGFELFDYEGDGDLDIAIVNGDNADLSVLPKPYHGLRLFINKGRNQFEEKLFVAINGATNVLARDFDRDGDVDFVASAFFPDEERAPGRSLLFLENVNAPEYAFDMQAIAGAPAGRWLVLTAGDFDGDGDEDVAVGSFTYAPESLTDNRFRSSENESPDILILENVLPARR